MIDSDLAKDLGLTIGDKLTLKAALGAPDVLFVSGIFDFGNRSQHSGAADVVLRTAQSLLALLGGVSRLSVKVAAPFEAEMRTRAKELIDRVGRKPWGHHLANDLSGGQQQRVAIARALVMQPALVLADEPTGNLDTQCADTIFDLMRSVSQTSGTTFLIVTHDPHLAKRCDRIIELVDGKINSDKPNKATHSGEDSAEDAPLAA